MKNTKTGNLFTDLYKVREKIFGIEAQASIDNAKIEVGEAIFSSTVPDKIRFLLFKTTNYCNSDCEYCPHAINRECSEEKANVPNEVIMRTLEQAAELGAEAIAISGGEPLVREDIIEIIEKSISCGILPVLLTNGILLENKWDDLGRAGLKYVIISIDSVDKEIYEKQRGVSFEQAMRGFEAAIKMRKKYDGVEIHVSAVLTKDNQENFLNLLKYMNDRKIKVQISPYHKRENDTEDYTIKEKEKIEQLTDELLKYKERGYLIANSVGFLKHLPDFFCAGKVMPDDFVCKTGYTSLAIDAYMNVKPCWSFLFEPIANLRESNLKDIWYSQKLQEYRRKMLRCECEGCWYLCTSEICMLLDGMVDC